MESFVVSMESVDPMDSMVSMDSMKSKDSMDVMESNESMDSMESTDFRILGKRRKRQKTTPLLMM